MEIKISEDLRNEIEKAQLEYEGYKDLYNSALSSSYNIPKEKLNSLETTCIEKLNIYNLAKDKINSLIPEEYLNENYSWSLDFQSCTVTVEHNG